MQSAKQEIHNPQQSPQHCPISGVQHEPAQKTQSLPPALHSGILQQLPPLRFLDSPSVDDGGTQSSFPVADTCGRGAYCCVGGYGGG
ncbi:hypothetical protein HK100_008962, partial [Physocladia obscura]